MSRKQKLELTWIGKETRPRLEPRILLEDPEKSYHAAHRVSEDDIFDNRLIFGDNLLALKALEKDFAGKIKCAYLDPPFNTGQAFEHYDDGVEHSLWLSLIRERVEIIHRLLSPDGSLWMHLDDNEVHYSKVLLDEIFGRNKFVSHISYERSSAAGLGQGASIVDTTEHILVYIKEKNVLKPAAKSAPIELATQKRFSRAIVDFGTREEIHSFHAKSNNELVTVYEHSGFKIHKISMAKAEHRRQEISSEMIEHFNGLFRTFLVQKENEFQHSLLQLMCKDKLYSVDYTPSRGKNTGQLTTLHYLNKELIGWLKDNAFVQDGEIVKEAKMNNFWTHAEIPKADLGNEGGVQFPRGKKPEQLLKRILEISTSPQDLVLDSFLGSGTTAATAHKMKRRWVAIELGEHCHSHCIPRLRSVIDATDTSGISRIVSWAGGGGFRYYRIAPSLLQQDEFGNWIINKKYNAAMLAEALCKLEGFTYAPSEDIYWQHGHSTESDFIYVTTQTLSREQLQKLSDEVGSSRSLLICCAAFRVKKLDDFPNLTLKKIPLAVMAKCEWGKDDYSLEIKALLDAPESPSSELSELTKDLPKTKRKARKAVDQTLMLFDVENAE